MSQSQPETNRSRCPAPKPVTEQNGGAFARLENRIGGTGRGALVTGWAIKKEVEEEAKEEKKVIHRLQIEGETNC